MSLTATRLEILSRVHDEGVTLSREDIAELIQAARLQVAMDDLPLPEGWQLELSVGRFGRHDLLGASTSYHWSLRHYRENVGPARSRPFVTAHGPTMLDSVLVLRTELGKR